MMRRPEYVMLHHSLTSDSKTVSWPAIRRYHTETMGWADIGYGYGVELIGGEYEVLVGRPETQVAAACKEGNMNKLAIHICLVGNFDLAPPPAAMVGVLVRRILKPVLDRYDISTQNIVGHRDYATYKSCPGTKLDLEMVRELCR